MSDQPLTRRAKKKKAAKKKRSSLAMAKKAAKKKAAARKMKSEEDKASKNKPDKKKRKKKRKKISEKALSAVEEVLEQVQQEQGEVQQPQEQVACAADLAAEQLGDASQIQLPKPVKPMWDDPYLVREHMGTVAQLPPNLRRREYETALKIFEISDSLYYRTYAGVALDRDELISLMLLVNGNYKEDTQSAIARFLSTHPKVRPMPNFRKVRFKDGAAHLVVAVDEQSESYSKESNKIKGSVRKAIVESVRGR